MCIRRSWSAPTARAVFSGAKLYASPALSPELRRETARRRRCDLIVLGAHGGGGLVSGLLGGQATRVLARSKIPVLICR